MQMIIMKIVLIIFLIVGVYAILKKKEKYKLIINEFFWIYISWMFCLMLYFFSGIKYTFNLNILSFAYILLVWGCFVLGHYISKYVKRGKREETKSSNNFEKINLLPFFIISIICVVIYSVYIIFNNDIIIGVTREIKTNAFTTIMLCMSSVSLIVWLYELAYSLLKNTRISYYGIISIFIFNIPGIIISGRDALIIFLISTIIVSFYCGNYAKNKLNIEGKLYKKLKLFFAIGFIGILTYLVLLSNNRYGIKSDSAINMFKWSAGCEFPKYLEVLYNTTGGFGRLVNNFIFYYSSQISKFAFIFDNYEGPYMCGLYQFHYISRLLPETWNLNYSLVSMELASLTNNVNIPGLKVLWETAIGYSIYDFGKIGTIFIAFLGGLGIGIINSFCNKNYNIIKIILKTFICLAMFITIEVSPIFDYFYIFPLFWIIVIYIVENIKNRKEKNYE